MKKYMKKILILGSCGAGKTTFAKRLHELIGIKIIHLDQCYWKPNWMRTEKDEWENEVKKLIQKEEWIMDVNYRSTLDIRIPAADTIIWLDFSRFVCLWRTIKRKIKNDRFDKLDGCHERINFDFIKWILWNFPRQNRKQLLKILREIKLAGEKEAYVLKSNKEIDLFLKKVENWAERGRA